MTFTHSALVITNCPADEWNAAINRAPAVIGRGTDADIEIPARFSTVSRRHAKVWKDDRFVYFSDLASKSGSSINGVWVKPNTVVEIEHGDRICLGSLELRFICSSTDDPKAMHLIDDQTWPLPQRDVSIKTRLQDLSHAELQVLLTMTRGDLDDEEIGRKLHRSPNTVRTQVGSIFKKINVHSRTQLIGLVMRQLESAGPDTALTAIKNSSPLET
ncbi:MAG: FHA domain-containing protein [Pirellula sp.]